MAETFAVGDTVRVGQGKTEWRIESFWTSGLGDELVTLEAVEGFAGTSVTVERLVLVKAGATT